MSTNSFTQSVANNSALLFNTANAGNGVKIGTDLVKDSIDFTIEAWIFVPAILPGPHSFISQGSNSQYAALALGYDGDNGGLIMMGDQWESDATVIPVNQWVHLAITNDATNQIARLYVNGVQTDSIENGYFTFDDGDNNFQLGDYPIDPDGSIGANGKLDEVRVWHTIRTAAQIKGGMFGYTAPNYAHLVAYYDMADTSSTTVHNVSTNTSGIDGTLAGTTSWTYSPVQLGNNALTFDGVDDQVVIPANTAYDISGAGTIEFWVNPQTLTGSATILTNQDTVAGALRYRVFMGQTYIGLQNDAAKDSVPYIFTPGHWYQIALASDGTQTTIYVNGVAINATANPISVNFTGSGAVSGKPITLGVTRVASANSNIFQGGIDELHFWNFQRLASDILSGVAVTPMGNETGLVGQFSFNEGTDNKDNQGLVTVVDNTVATNNATLENFALTAGSSSNYTLNVLSFPTPVDFSLFTATKSGSKAVLNWQTAQEENSRDFIIERSIDGANFASIGSTPAAGNSSLRLNYQFIDEMPLDGTNYYRIREEDKDGNGKYTTVKTLFFGSADLLTWYAPRANTAIITLKNGNSELYTLSDASGKALRQGQLSAGKTTVTNVPAGLYVLNIILPTGAPMSKQIVVY